MTMGEYMVFFIKTVSRFPSNQCEFLGKQQNWVHNGSSEEVKLIELILQSGATKTFQQSAMYDEVVEIVPVKPQMVENLIEI